MANPHIHEICRLMGISDIYVKIYGSKNPMNVTKTFFQALQAQKTPKDIARIRGQKVVDVEMSYYGYSASSATTTSKGRA
jgi:ribosomal protein S5